MKQCVVDAIFGLEADHGHRQSVENQADDGTVDHDRKTRQRDHQCHCGKKFQVGETTFLLE